MDNMNVSNLLSTKMCSPMIIFTVIVVVFGISLFNTRSTLKKFNSTKWIIFSMFIHGMKLR